MCVIPVDGRHLLATAGHDETVRLWGPQTRADVLTVPTHYAALAPVCVTDSWAIGLNVGVLVIRLNAAV
jgi:hypothetical protein